MAESEDFSVIFTPKAGGVEAECPKCHTGIAWYPDIPTAYQHRTELGEHVHECSVFAIFRSWVRGWRENW